jgi:arylsulfatase A-like enzyme
VRRVVRVLAVLSALPSCGPSSPAPPPSILLYVMDTTRVDAVSAYGRVAGTTPTVDRLAAAGLRYTRAYALAPWTVPSHATIFTGLPPSRHRVTWRDGLRAADALVTLAERLRDAGYQTIGLSENGLVSDTFNLTQGFERFAVVRRTVPTARRWIRGLDARRPFFLFVNVMDAHAPYAGRGGRAHLPPGTSVEALRALPVTAQVYQCRAAAHAGEIGLLRGLYLGDVRAADEKLGALLGELGRRGLDRHLITIVTADHGEHFGEHDLVAHMFSVYEPLLHVPLVVHGLDGVPPATVDTPVGLHDVVPSALSWAGVAVPPDLPGRPLPTQGGDHGPPRALVAELSDPASGGIADQTENRLRRTEVGLRAHNCTAGQKVYGDMQALVRYPLKLVWFERYPAELYDLREDPEERRDLALERPEQVAELAGELAGRMADERGLATAGPAVPGAVLTDDMRRKLEALGYLGAE